MARAAEPASLARDLEALRLNWGDAYETGFDGDWWMRRKAGGARQAAGTAAGLNELIAADWKLIAPAPAAEPRSRHPVVPERGSVRTAGDRLGTVMRAGDYPVTATCSACGHPVRCASYFTHEWVHTGPEPDGGRP
ncbi:MAG TPA: hypothetical protein VKU77_36995 [Streptosporangiaceae bacterium]|nr:hypothetical protein [Streptosporangiaceae bacterium]